MSNPQYQNIYQIEGLLEQNKAVPRVFLQQLRSKARSTDFLNNFDPTTFERLLSGVFLKVSELQDELDVISTIANILLTNDNLRNMTRSENPQVSDTLASVVPKLFTILDLVSERQINSESQFKDFLPIFRLYFLLSHNRELLPLLKGSIMKITGKLLNFVTMSSSESFNLNVIIVEILKIIYSYIHQAEDTAGIDSSFVLSCNKFQLLYAKEVSNKEYDEILQHFGNVLLAISPEILRNYMMNKIKFAENEVRFLNRIASQSVTIGISSPVSNLLTLSVLIDIDSSETSGVLSHIQENLNISQLEQLRVQDPNFKHALIDLKSKLLLNTDIQSKSQLAVNPATGIPSFVSSPLDDLGGILNNTQESSYHSVRSQTKSGEQVPRFEDLSEEEQNIEINKMNDLFDRIEKNGIFKLKMK